MLLPAILKHHGNQTSISGKLHFIPHDHDYSFDFFWSFANEGPRKLSIWLQDVAKKHGGDDARKLTVQPFPDDPLEVNAG